MSPLPPFTLAVLWAPSVLSRAVARAGGALTLLIAVLVLGPSAGHAQFGDRSDPSDGVRMQVGGALLYGQPRGEFREYVQSGFGIDGFARLTLDAEGWVALRVDGALLNYGQETRRVCLSTTVGCRIQVDLTTSNNIISGGIGPELSIPLGASGGGLYAGVSGGFSYFSTDSSVRGTSSSTDPDFASTRNFSDFGWAWNAGGGVRVPLRGGDNPIALDLGVRRMDSGLREYLTRGDIDERSDGSLILNIRRSEADILLWRVGVAVGLGPTRGR